MQAKVSSAVLWKVGARYLLRHRWQSLLMVLGITLGVAVVVAIDMANASAQRAFELSTEAVAGSATHEITGGPEGLDDQLYAQLRRSGLVQEATPVVSVYVSSPQLGGQPLQLLGVDPFSSAPFLPYLGQNTGLSLGQLVPFLTKPGGVLLSQEMARRYGLKQGDRLTLDVNGEQRAATLVGLIQSGDALSQRKLSGLILADISTVQEISGRLGMLDRIDLILPDDNGRTLAKLQSWLPQGDLVTASDARSGSVAQMTAAFRLNLTALSLLALVVGLFLIYNTMTFSVVQRRALFGVLRCLGVTRQEVFLLVVVEALLLGLVGGILGTGLGVLMGRQTVAMVTQTVNDLYFTTTVQNVGVPVASLIKGGLLGVLASAGAAALPAWEAASVPPEAALLRSTLERKARRAVYWTALGGLSCFALGGLLFTQPGLGLPGGFGGTLAVIVGFALLSALILVLLMRLASPLLGRLFGLLGRMAPRNLENSLSRTAVSVAALMIAVSVTIGVSLMIDSFRHTVDLWLEATLQGDIYISAPTYTGTAPSAPINPNIVDEAPTWPGVERVNLLRTTPIQSPDGPVEVYASNNNRLGQERMFLRTRAGPEQVWPDMQAGGILVSEPLARRLGLLKPGSSLKLYTQKGWVDFPVAGVFYDYSSSQGTLLMALDVYRRNWNDTAVTSMDLRLKPGTDPDQLTRQLQDSLSAQQRLLVRPNRVLRQEVLAIFDRTFAITAALRLLATVVAFIGILNTLLLLQMEKQRELGILRALGLTGRQLWKLVMLETGLMGLVAGVLAAPAGYTLALILIYVINQRSFGWTLQQALPPGAFVQALGISVAAALLAGIYPARKLSSMPAAEAIRYE